MEKYYFESAVGGGIRTAKSLEVAKDKILREVGEINWEGDDSVRLATDEDINWVMAMGGRIS